MIFNGEVVTNKLDGCNSSDLCDFNVLLDFVEEISNVMVTCAVGNSVKDLDDHPLLGMKMESSNAKLHEVVFSFILGSFITGLIVLLHIKRLFRDATHNGMDVNDNLALDMKHNYGSL